VKETRRIVFVAAALVLLGLLLVLLRTWATAERSLVPEKNTKATFEETGSSSGGRFFRAVDMRRLPAEAQKTVTLLLLLPIGILATAFFRNIIGVQTFGTTLPSLLALGFAYADPRAGLVILAVLISAVLALRALLARLRLLMVPRLGLTMTLALALLAPAIAAMGQFGMKVNAADILPAIFVCALVAERVLVGMEDEGFRYAMRVLAGTLFISLLCLPAMKWEAVGRAVLRYPEIHFGTAGLLILIGRYPGYRLSELWRFRSLAENSPSEAQK
jgi:hypothetical protein